MEATIGKANCIVLTPKPEHVNEELKQLLEARNWHVRQTNVPLLAMSDLCLLERTQASRSAWGLSRSEGIALIVVEPEHWPELQTMLGAIAQYLPIVSIWSYEKGKLQCVSEPIENNQSHDEFETNPVIKHDEDDGVTDLHISGDELAMLLDIEDQENQS
ncbi:MAG: hypothetical protein IH984_13315 [Planctomycetes bacterium]|nr:hypothetical protein [Planctomycetota bacterium]